MSEEKVVVQSGGGIGLFGLTFIVFLVLKLTGTITWSWWWVTAPLWGPACLTIAILIFIGVLALVAVIIALIFESLESR